MAKDFGDIAEPDGRLAETVEYRRPIPAAEPLSAEEASLFPQTRALEIRLPTGFDAADAPRLAWEVKRAGFNTILLSCFRGGYTAYESPAMRAWKFPAQDPRFRGIDPVAPVLSAAQREGLTVYALAECLAVGGDGGKRGPILRRRSEWAIRGRERAVRFLCPVNREVWRFLGDLFYECLERYSFRGIYLRQLQFPLEPPGQRSDFCRCDYCRSSVWHSLGVRIHEIPDDPDHPDRYNLTSWRGKQLAGLLRYVRLRLAKVCAPSLTLAELALSDTGEPLQPESCGYADACAWAVDRLVPLAVVRPLPGTSQASDRWVERVASLTECALVMPVLSAQPESRLVETLTRLSALPISGVAVLEPHDLTAPPLNQLARRLWRERTQVTEERPLVAVCALLNATIRLLPADAPLSAFLADVLRVVEPLGEQWPPQQCETLYENLRGLEERISDEKMNLGPAAPAVLRNFRLARQLLRLVEIES